MESVTAKLVYELWVDCPRCFVPIDLLADHDYDCEGEFSIPIFNNKWGELIGKEVECENCKKVFQIEEVEY